MRWFRPAITGILVAGLTAGFFMDKITAEVFVPLVAVAITWLFKSRDEEKKLEKMSR